MKKLKKISIALFIAAISGNVNAQLSGLDFIFGNTNDAHILMQEYMRPYANIMGANLNAGWYNTAKPHKLGGFDITLTTSVAFAPNSILTYDLSTLQGLSAQVPGTNTFAPTVAGNMETTPELVFSKSVVNPVTDVTETFEFSVPHPNGTGIDFLPMPMAQLTLGLIKGTDVTVRYLPQIGVGDFGEVGIWGVGGKHSISQWIPVLKSLDFINISLQGGYSKISTTSRLNLQPPDVEVISVSNPPAFDDQFLDMNISGWTINVIASQSIPVITVYEGIGYSNSMVDLAMLGHYPRISIVDDQGADYGKTTYEVIEDPLELEFENNNNLRLNAGIRLKLGLLTIHYDFTKTLYATHTAGIGISFR
ncbi:MAG: hypothetical protein K9J30_04125 [Bacteroidales bacterium]|nr:hypothetical protein [Bacteroidales bacterium]